MSGELQGFACRLESPASPEGEDHFSQLRKRQCENECEEGRGGAGMRIALMMCGQPRTMEFCFPSQKKHILDAYHPDVFIYSDDQRQRMIELYNPVTIDVRCQEEISRLAAE